MKTDIPQQLFGGFGNFVVVFDKQDAKRRHHLLGIVGRKIGDRRMLAARPGSNSVIDVPSPTSLSKPLPVRDWYGRLSHRRYGCIAFWRDLNLQAAAVSTASIFLLGDAVGHVKQMLIAGNFAPGNAGVPFYMDTICPVLAIALLVIAKRQSAVRKS